MPVGVGERRRRPCRGALHPGRLARDARTADIPAVGRAYVTTASLVTVSVHQTSAMRDALSSVLQELVGAYEFEDSIESRLAGDAGQARDCSMPANTRPTRHDTSQWRSPPPSRTATDTGGDLADAIIATTPTTWRSPFRALLRAPRTDPRKT
jgi:hypothetical protein